MKDLRRWLSAPSAAAARPPGEVGTTICVSLSSAPSGWAGVCHSLKKPARNRRLRVQTVRTPIAGGVSPYASGKRVWVSGSLQIEEDPMYRGTLLSWGLLGIAGLGGCLASVFATGGQKSEGLNPNGWRLLEPVIYENLSVFPVVSHQGVDTGGKTLKFSYIDRKSTRLNSSHVRISYAVFCLKKKKSVE